MHSLTCSWQTAYAGNRQITPFSGNMFRQMRRRLHASKGILNFR